MDIAIVIIVPLAALLTWARLMVRAAPLWQFLVAGVFFAAFAFIAVRSDGLRHWPPLSTDDFVGAGAWAAGVVMWAYGSQRTAARIGRFSATSPNQRPR